MKKNKKTAGFNKKSVQYHQIEKHVKNAEK